MYEPLCVKLFVSALFADGLHGDGVKNRIGGILKYKKPGKWLTAFAVMLCLTAVAGCFLMQEESGPGGAATFTPTSFPTVTATPTPTMVPETEPTAGPTAAGEMRTPTPLTPSDLELLGDVTPETVLAVPMGQTAEVDLDGDGTKDVITCGYEGYEKNKTMKEVARDWRLREFWFQLIINGRTFRDNDIREEYWNDGPGFTTYYIFDVNTEDKYKEIGLYFDGPSGDPSTALYRYINGELYCVGRRNYFL